ncbi:MAG: FeoB-associated Cys-rich membrane protein [Chthoniobacteraceae bacterium]
MNETVQQILVGVAIVGALLYLVRRSRKKKSGGCGCVTKKPLK